MSAQRIEPGTIFDRPVETGAEESVKNTETTFGPGIVPPTEAEAELFNQTTEEDIDRRSWLKRHLGKIALGVGALVTFGGVAAGLTGGSSEREPSSVSAGTADTFPKTETAQETGEEASAESLDAKKLGLEYAEGDDAHDVIGTLFSNLSTAIEARYLSDEMNTEVNGAEILDKYFLYDPANKYAGAAKANLASMVYIAEADFKFDILEQTRAGGSWTLKVASQLIVPDSNYKPEIWDVHLKQKPVYNFNEETGETLSRNVWLVDEIIGDKDAAITSESS